MLLSAGGFAVASLAPDASDLQVHEILESVQTQPLQAQIDQLEDHAFRLYRSELTRSSDTTVSLFKRLGIDDPAAAAYLRSDPVARQALLGRAGRNVTAEVSEGNVLLRLSARWSPDDSGSFKRLVVEKTATGFKTAIEMAPLTASARLASGTIQTSLFAATDDARIPDPVAVQLAEIFSGDVDFHRALRKGDRFSVVYESLEGDGEPMRSGRVLSAEFVNKGKTYQAMWFNDPAATGPDASSRSKGAYYTLDGHSLKRGMLASPMEFSRVTSGFKMRFHPILQKWMAHQGVDYAAPTGTPVRSVGEGVVEFAGVQNGYGNVIYIGHKDHKSTVYAHLSRIDVKRGQNVSQSQVIGAVGSTGWATGPHLHFELRINGVYHDPSTIAQQIESSPMSAALKPVFDRFAASARQQLAAAATIRPVTTQ
jgi:murein DD-endopeptidase MepM/ murein hydrolase activator NlpD